MIEATVAAQPSQLYTDRETNTITRHTDRQRGIQAGNVQECAGVYRTLVCRTC